MSLTSEKPNNNKRHGFGWSHVFLKTDESYGRQKNKNITKENWRFVFVKVSLFNINYSFKNDTTSLNNNDDDNNQVFVLERALSFVVTREPNPGGRLMAAHDGGAAWRRWQRRLRSWWRHALGPGRRAGRRECGHNLSVMLHGRSRW